MKSLFKLFTLLFMLILPAVVMAAPTVTEKSPADGAIDVEITTPVTAAFSETMKASSITTDSLPITRFVGVKAVAAGYEHTVALKGDGTVIAWGGNTYGQTDVPAGLTGVVAVAAGWAHTVALKSDGTVVGWGRNTELQISIPVDLTGVIAVAAGQLHTVALKGDGTVAAWGNNQNGQTNIPVGLTGVVTISAGEAHTLALKGDGTVAAWGYNSGQISVPADLAGVVAVAAGGGHSMALKGDGTVVAWGNNSSGQVSVPVGLNGITAIAAGRNYCVALKGDGTVAAWGDYGQAYVPAGLTGVVAVSAGWYHAVALKSDSTMVAWGDNTFSQSSVPASLTGVVAVSASPASYSIALKGDGTVAAWGFNNSGQISVPAGLTGVTAIASGYNHTVALKNDGTVTGWGSNYYGEITAPGDLVGVIAVAAGQSHSVALKGDGTVAAWGLNNSGQISVPAGLTGVMAVAAGASHTVALKNDGTVTGWGSNYYGESTAPGDLTGVIAVAAGQGHTVALKGDGTVFAWGNNGLGQCNVPAGLTGVMAVSTNGAHNMALKGDGTVVAWGKNDYGLNNVPAGLTGVTAISAGDGRSLALKGDGTVVAWGENYYGQGTVPFDPYTIPVAATVNYNGGSNIATITPTLPLLNNTTYTVTANTGIKNSAGTALAADTSWSFKTITKQYNITFAATAGGTLSGTAYQTVNHGDSATAVTAVPDTGYHFVNWTGTDGFATTIANPLTVANVTAEQTITANFAINTYDLKFVSGGNGTLTGTASQTVNYNSSATAVTAVPATGYHLVNWTGTGGFVTTTDNPLTVTNVMTAQNITANFAINTYDLKFVSGGNGTIQGIDNQTINYDAAATAVLAVPAAGYAFANWTGTGGFVTSTSNPLTVTNVKANQEITANFIINAFVITKDAIKPFTYKGAKNTLKFTATPSLSIDSIKSAISATSPLITYDLAKLKFVKGKGSLPYTVTLNNEPTPRTGMITIGNDTYTINQTAHPCVITSAITNPLTPLPAAGGVQSITVNVEPNSCQWKVASYKTARDTWFSSAWSFPDVDAPITGDLELIGTVPANTTGKARSNTIVIITADGKSKKSITLKQQAK